MKTSLNEIALIEKFLSGKLQPGEALLLRAKMLIDPVLKFNIQLHKLTLRLIRIYGRKQLKSEVQAVHGKLFSDPHKKHYQQDILQLFNKS